MTVLFVGDLVGPDAVHWLAARMPRLRDDLDLDWVVVNAENCAITGPNPMDGFGMTVELVDTLLRSGVDVITGGNHSWDGPDVAKVLAYPQVVRPFNIAGSGGQPGGAEATGQGLVTVGTGRRTLTVVNLLSPTAALPGMRAPQPTPLWPAWQAVAGHLPAGSVLIDLHGESAWEKASFATAVDGEVAAVLGTHTHDPTARCHILPRGTGYVTEVGMTGRLGHTGGGFDPEHFAATLRGEDHTKLDAYRLSSGELALGAVVFTTHSGQPNRVRRITRVD